MNCSMRDLKYNVGLQSEGCSTLKCFSEDILIAFLFKMYKERQWEKEKKIILCGNPDLSTVLAWTESVTF